ncbi:OmpA family protein [Taibaiella chishuiensis]|uniref:OmpA family protein n=1 Tax=Taibaiella chishuiensis TaxID=1434707 RepID=A0A2P8DA92_9BACT|nr:OmpA family protein [Taibaiella chishuiensis]PSK94132.1 OmpA family protein [Taibaiella chishuiensis]
MRRKSLLFLLSAFLLTAVVHDEALAQKDKYRNKANDPVAQLGYEKKLRWADGLFKSGSYYNAYDYYQQLLQEQPRNPYLVYQAAECAWFMRDYIPASKYYGYAYSLSSTLYPEAIYKEALMLKMQGSYEQAITRFQKFITDNPKTFKKLKKRAQREIDGCKMAMNSVNNPIPANVKNLGANVNTAYTELSPYPLGDTALLFATMKSNNIVEVGKEKRSDYVSRFMVSHKFKRYEERDTFQWPLPFLDGRFNDDKYHVGNGCFSPGGDRFYFTKCLENEKNEMTCRIFCSTFEKEKWGNPVLLGEGINDDGSSSTQPYIAKVGKKEVLFFSSNRVLQSRGGYDIWYSVYDPRQKTYRRPQNAGKQINTEGNEASPYYDNRVNKLYFASDGWVTMGGFDIYSANGGPSRYTNLTNLGYPINTSADELYYIHDPMGKPDAYVVSNRPGSIALKNPTCCDDIWRIQYEPKIYAMGKVLDQKSQKPVAQTVVKMVDEAGNIKTYNSENGEFQFLTARGHNYVLTADKQNYTSTRATVSTEGIKRQDPDDTVFVTIYVDSVFIDKDFLLKNILYDYDKATLRPEAAASLEELTTLMKDNPSLDVRIFSYTDSKGTEAYNKNLSQQRAESVVNYLVRNGIERSRLSAQGMGKDNPVAPNKTESGKDNPDGRQLNRRTTFRILTDVPTRRTIYDSSKPGTIGEQEKNLELGEGVEDTEPADSDSKFGNPGSRVN